MGLKNNPHEHQDTIFASILADGKIHVSVPEGTEGAIERAYETDADKKAGKGKKSGSKFELIYTELSGMIENVNFHDGTFGLSLQIVIKDEDDEKPVTLSLSTDSNFGEDMMKKLPAINMKKAVTLAPFSFENNRGKNTRGITVTQLNKKGEAEKVASFYYDTTKKVNINGFPATPKPKAGKPLSKTDWRKYFGVVRDFLIEDITKKFKIDEKDSKTKADKEFEDF